MSNELYEPSIHDSLLTGYVVDGVTATIVLHTEPHFGGGDAYVDVVFDGVATYRFKDDLLQNIVFDIEEASVEETLAITDRIQAEQGRWGFPREWNIHKETASECFKRLNVKVFELGSSYGMTGWIAARTMSHVVSFTPGHVPAPSVIASNAIRHELIDASGPDGIAKQFGTDAYDRFIPGIHRALTLRVSAWHMAEYLALLHTHALGLPTSAEALEAVAARLVALEISEER